MSTPDVHPTPPTDSSPDPALVELVARALAQSRKDPAFTIEGGEHWGRAHWRQMMDRERAQKNYRADARAVLSALADQPLPAGGETRTEWGWCGWSADDPQHGMPLRDETAAREVVAEHPGTTLVRRWVGPWQPVPTTTEAVDVEAWRAGR